MNSPAGGTRVSGSDSWRVGVSARSQTTLGVGAFQHRPPFLERQHMDRYIATSAAGEHVIRTNDKTTADHYAALMRGQVIDTEGEFA